jgi:hypothetical protein
MFTVAVLATSMRLSLCVVFRVCSQVGCGGVPNVVVFHDDIGALYGFSAGFLANKPVNSLLLF